MSPVDIHDDAAEQRWLTEPPTIIGETSMFAVEPTRADVAKALEDLNRHRLLDQQQRMWVSEHLDDTPPRELLDIVGAWVTRRRPEMVKPARETHIINQAVLVCIPAWELDHPTLDELEEDLSDAISDVGHLRGHMNLERGTVIYMYGDAQLIWDGIEPLLRTADLPPASYALIRSGPPGAQAQRLDL